MRCHLCYGPFGLVRHRIVTLGGSLHFCSKKCVEEYRERLQQEVRKRKFQDWLHEKR
jgi:hypothetical protein